LLLKLGCSGYEGRGREGGWRGIIGEKEGRVGERGNEGGRKRERERGMEERGEKRYKYQEASLELGNGEGKGECNFINASLMEGLPSLCGHGRPFLLDGGPGNQVI